MSMFFVPSQSHVNDCIIDVDIIAQKTVRFLFLPCHHNNLIHNGMSTMSHAIDFHSIAVGSPKLTYILATL